ncbi:hypothetical protein RRG08_034386 [Elysia crispata]|uniref:TM2 domain-containing protein n=1 Tax=Elysia crispata TaxID=231223 RepID=A0AAE0YDF7_9GAST|nr:hypothetical protein RRG08_034386 [Elysia crispata]
MSTTHQKEFLLKKALVSWHILSMILFILTLSVCGALSSATESDVSRVGTDIELTTASTPNSMVSNTTSNETDDTNDNVKAASCSLDVTEVCPENVKCSLLGGECIDCDFNTSCQYGTIQKAYCSPKANVSCEGARRFKREYHCRYCYQLPEWQTWCNQTTDCALNKPRTHWPARPFFVSTCWTKSEFLCMGRRCFHKQASCNWSNGYKWSKAMLYSIFLGGFGVDRFYLRYWVEGIGKLLSFGGLGVWTLVDVILIGVGYLGPSDGSLYI